MARCSGFSELKLNALNNSQTCTLLKVTLYRRSMSMHSRALARCQSHAPAPFATVPRASPQAGPHPAALYDLRASPVMPRCGFHSAELAWCMRFAVPHLLPSPPRPATCPPTSSAQHGRCSRVALSILTMNPFPFKGPTKNAPTESVLNNSVCRPPALRRWNCSSAAVKQGSVRNAFLIRLYCFA